ncbi:MAG: universal stress protein [Candidatus Thermoplasmatota archaeon]|jgi:nucleotide-binding universal stress UspA family protein|nr:universal stress protein [Candidatus Thermoplasmatota archaeon]MCL5984473.1 universal stress protein [Candidatus Thermoplasmatota archaeon]
MYQKILVPVVVPANVEPLVRLAAHLLDPGGEIHVLNIITANSMPEVAKGWRNSLHVVIPAHETAAALDVQVVPEVAVARDVPVEILEKAETLGAHAILMTLSGDRKKRRRFLGHISTAILNHAACDVVIVNPLALSGGKLGKLILPTFTVQPPAKAMAAAEALSSNLGNIPIVTLHMLESKGKPLGPSTDHEFRGRQGKIPRQLKTVLFPARLFHSTRLLPSAIVDEIRKEGFGMCIIGQEGRGHGDQFISRAFLEELFAISPFPIVVLRA